jgi:hypothetical protein
MPKSQTYMNRALQSRDPRFARILGKLGYGDDLPVAVDTAEPDLLDLKKDELIALAEAEGVDVSSGDTKAEIADKILKARD